MNNVKQSFPSLQYREVFSLLKEREEIGRSPCTVPRIKETEKGSLRRIASMQ